MFQKLCYDVVAGVFGEEDDCDGECVGVWECADTSGTAYMSYLQAITEQRAP